MSSSSDEEVVVRNPYSITASGQRSSRRSRVTRGQELKSRALEEMKRVRDSGGVHRVDVANLIKPVYDEVDEEEYMKIVQEWQKDNFVVDDDGSGYVDRGVDFFDEEQPSTTRKPKKPEEKRDKTKRKAIGDFFHTLNAKKVKEENTVSVANDPEVEALINDCDLSKFLKGDQIKEVDCLETNSVSSVSSQYYGSEIAVKFESKSKEISEREKRLDEIRLQPSLTTGGGNSTKLEFIFQESAERNSMHISTRADNSTVLHCAINKYAKDSIVEEVGQTETFFKWADCESKTELSDELVKGSLVTSADTLIRKNSDGKSVLRFYWLDAFEDPVRIPGTVYLFGKLFNGGISESCCVVVKNIWRQIFFLPREKRVVNMVQTDEEIDLVKVNEEVQHILRSVGVKVVKCRPCEKKFACNDGVVPRSAQVLEVHYSFNDPRLAVDLNGETFSHVFNITANALERLLVEIGMKGPSWIEVSGCNAPSHRVSYVKHEFVVDMERMKSISVVDCSDPPPQMNLLTMNVVTAINEKKENEIVLISCMIDRKCTTTNPTLDRNFLERFCIITKPTLCAYPFDFKISLKQVKMDTVVHETVNERHLLNHFLCKLQKLDPDAYVGHNLPAQFAALSSRLEKLGIVHWSRLGRLKRSIPIKQAANIKASQWELTAGRLVLDSRLSAMELVKMRSYDLSDLSSDLLGVKHFPMNRDIASYFANSKELIKFIDSTWMDAWLSVAVIVELNALPLFIQITKIVGGVLSRTMMGGRAERNEYLLLHAFNKAGYVAPNKYQSDFKKKQSKLEEAKIVSDDLHEDSKIPRNRKGQYVGGLVLDPKTGLYDTFILLLDFNSLYPSIIQEYNICFTTVDMSKKDKNEVPELPSDTNEGILPREIRTLVERRRDVRRMMKSEKLTQQQRQQYDIRQMGLKLTANSMYGCLGFQQSRFYAKPLAALITAQGREILMNTKNLIEKNGYSVIYGDTDSVMINTGLSGRSELQHVKKLGNDIKKIINQSYQKLEIDVDGIFMKLLLLKKKKYAGLSVDLNDERKTKREIKGLDIIRRDYSLIVKKIGNEILDIILSEQTRSRDEIVDQIYSHLRKLREAVDQELVEIWTFQIFKQLTRNPDEYADIIIQPHASVAQRLNATGKFKFHRGDTIGYVICEDGSGKSATQRAYHLTEVLENNLKIDFHYYLTQQVLPVVSRLCVPIEECDEAWIAQALGLFVSEKPKSLDSLNSLSYRKHVICDENTDEENQLLCFSHYSFEHCESFKFICPNDGCGYEFTIRECLIQKDHDEQKLWLSECSVCQVSLISFGAYLQNQLKLTLDRVISEYYKISYVCDDIGCAYRSRTLAFMWTREGAPCSRCKSGFMKKEYSSKRLYEQLTFYHKLFDVTKAMDSLTREQKMKLQSRSGWKGATALLAGLLSLCDQYIADNQYNHVSLSYLFASMRSL